MDSWVKLRHKCSPVEVFIMLHQEAFEDVKVRTELMGKDDSARFRITESSSDGKRFGVVREQSEDYDVVSFSLEKSGIAVRNRDGKVIQEAALTLTDDGDCKLKLVPSGEELDRWQFRKRFLESLFFNF